MSQQQQQKIVVAMTTVACGQRVFVIIAVKCQLGVALMLTELMVTSSVCRS